MLRGIAVVTLVLAALLALLWVSQRRMIYFPTQTVPSVAEVDYALEAISYPTEDGLTLRAWLVPASGDPLGAVLVFNGNAGNRAHRLALAEALSRAGYEVLLADYRGYGGNPGSPSEQGLAHDARAALAFLRSRPEVDERRIVYFGESLGAGVAVGLAREQAPAALVLRSPFASLPEIAAVHYPLIPASLLLRDRYDSMGVVGEITTPLLVIAGSDDRIVPVEQSRRLFDAANEPKRMVVVEGAGHNDLALLNGAEMIAEIVKFLEESLPAR
jgi:fermentation-respiration switch protein FrsA (DUF1100 family)